MVPTLFILDFITISITGGSSTAPFTLVDRTGAPARAGDSGLLLYNGATVCDDSFSTFSADAICREMGFDRAQSWTAAGSTFSQQWDIQNRLITPNIPGPEITGPMIYLSFSQKSKY